MDANNDGEISKAEAKGPLVRDFDRVDVNGEGKLPVAELKNIKGRGGPRSVSYTHLTLPTILLV